MKQTIIAIISSVLGALLTYLLRKFGISTVLSACMIGATGSLVSYYTKSPQLALIVFIGTFIGMGNYKDYGGIYLIILAGIFAGIMYQITEHLFVNFGGRLGTIAFISVVISYLLYKVVNTLQ